MSGAVQAPMFGGASPDDFPLSFRDRNWELVRYSWDEKTGLGSFAYEHKYTGGKVEEKRYQGKYWLPEEVRTRLMPALPLYKSAKRASKPFNGPRTVDRRPSTTVRQ